jgi:hypothetical protein
MTTVFVIQNQHGHYLNKQLEWVDGHDKRTLYRTVHRDEAINVVFEQSSKNIELRAHPLECQTDESAQPKVEACPTIISQQDDFLGEEHQISQTETEDAQADTGSDISVEMSRENISI